MPRISAFLVAEDLSYRLPDRRTLFHSLTLGFHRERTALVGPNGSGKSTLVDLLRGAVRPTSGRVRREGRLAHLAQDPPLEEGATLAHLMGIEAPLRALLRLHAGTGTPEDVDRVGGAWDLPEAAARALRRAGLPRLADEALLPGGAGDPGMASSSLLRPVGRLSGGERTRARLAGLLLQEPDVLLLDEPTNHLDGPSREAIRGLLATWEGGVVVATHDRALLRSVDRIVELGPPVPRVVTGDLDRWDTVRRAEEEAARRGVDHARKELARTRRVARETAERQARRNARGARSARESNEPKILLGARKEWSQGTTARLRERGARKEEAARAALSRARDRVTEGGTVRAWTAPVELPARREIFRLEGVVPSTPGGVPLALPLTARWAGPVRVAVTGPNGCGKTTLLRILAGEVEPGSGGLVRGVTPAEVGFLRQHREEGGPATVLSAFRQTHPALPEERARTLLAAFLFPGEAVRKPVAVLSGGERIRLALASLLGGEPPRRSSFWMSPRTTWTWTESGPWRRSWRDGRGRWWWRATTRSSWRRWEWRRPWPWYLPRPQPPAIRPSRPGSIGPSGPGSTPPFPARGPELESFEGDPWGSGGTNG
jgi:ATPase subunit of ABC transporter with duplicated ATPase domains